MDFLEDFLNASHPYSNQEGQPMRIISANISTSAASGPMDFQVAGPGMASSGVQMDMGKAIIVMLMTVLRIWMNPGSNR